MATLIITESSAKARAIGSALRNTEKDSHWLTVAAAGVDADWPRKGRGSGITPSLRPKFNIRNRAVLNKVIQEATEAEEILIATEDSREGEALALHLKRELLEKMPSKTVRRLRLRALSPEKVAEALANKDDVNELQAESQIAGRVIDRLMSLSLNDRIGHIIGRAITPSMAVLQSMATKGKASLIAEYDHALFGDNKVIFLSDPAKSDDVRKAAECLVENPTPRLERVTEELASPPPRAYNTTELIKDGIWILGLKGIEVTSQAKSLFDAGLITSPIGACGAMDWVFVRTVLSKIKALAGGDFCGDAFGWTKTGVESCHPVDINVDPSEVPKPVRPLYRMIWARTLSSCCKYAKVSSEQVSFQIPETSVVMKAHAIKIIEHGHDRLGMGMFLRDHKVPDDLDLKYHEIFEDGWPHEVDLIDKLAKVMPLGNPAAVVKSLENLDYVRFQGSRVVPTFMGHSMITAVEEIVPELMSAAFFTQIEYRLGQIASGDATWDEVIPEYNAWIDMRTAKEL